MEGVPAGKCFCRKKCLFGHVRSNVRILQADGAINGLIYFFLFERTLKTWTTATTESKEEDHRLCTHTTLFQAILLTAI